MPDLPSADIRPLRREMQMIFQAPFTSLNPRMTLLDIVGEPLLVNGVTNRHERTKRVAEILPLVRLRPEYTRRHPHAFSGGQRQRLVIARALALHPRLVVACCRKSKLPEYSAGNRNPPDSKPLRRRLALGSAKGVLLYKDF